MSAGNAFPWTTTEEVMGQFNKFAAVVSKGGLSKRELFAAMAMQGWLSSASTVHAMESISSAAENEDMVIVDWIARNSVASADALLAALAKPTEGDAR